MQLPPTIPQWFGTAKNKDVRSLIRSHRSLVRFMSQSQTVLNHSASYRPLGENCDHIKFFISFDK